MKVERLGDRVHYLPGFPYAAIVVTDDGVVSFDGPMLPGPGRAWRRHVDAQGPLRASFLLEHHMDHVFAASYLEPPVLISTERTDADFYATTESEEGARKRLLALDPDSAEEIAGLQLRRPDLTFSERLTMTVGGSTFVAFHAPGHTPGSMVVHAVEDRVAFVADNLSPGLSLAFSMGSADVEGWFPTLALLESLDVDWFLSGHGEPCGKEELGAHRERLLETIGVVRELRDRGLSRTAAEAEIVRMPIWDAWGRSARVPYAPTPSGAAPPVSRTAGIARIYESLDQHTPTSTKGPDVEAE
ncbi:MAG: MBL fold metallo-hydrolase [Actinobacteria bacterium]|nr:MBL fold metallo-hydrolase [Actinomycetota bacterium]